MGLQGVQFTFQDCLGNPLANGLLTGRLNIDGANSSSGSNISSGVILSIPLDSSGSCTFTLWPNDQIIPAGTVYFFTAYTAKGQRAWSQQMSILTSVGGAFLLQETSFHFLLEDGTGALLLE